MEKKTNKPLNSIYTNYDQFCADMASVIKDLDSRVRRPESMFRIDSNGLKVDLKIGYKEGRLWSNKKTSTKDYPHIMINVDKEYYVNVRTKEELRDILTKLVATYGNFYQQQNKKELL